MFINRTQIAILGNKLLFNCNEWDKRILKQLIERVLFNYELFYKKEKIYLFISNLF